LIFDGLPGKLFDIDVTDCITQDSSDDSSDFSRLSHDHEQKRDLKKKKVKKDTCFASLWILHVVTSFSYHPRFNLTFSLENYLFTIPV
jgi:hypothetical protein